MSFEKGMYSLVETLAGILGPRLVTGKRVSGVDKKGTGYTLHFADGTQAETDVVAFTSRLMIPLLR